jgi:hypothetical protein
VRTDVAAVRVGEMASEVNHDSVCLGCAEAETGRRKIEEHLRFGYWKE